MRRTAFPRGRRLAGDASVGGGLEPHGHLRRIPSHVVALPYGVGVIAGGAYVEKVLRGPELGDPERSPEVGLRCAACSPLA